MEYPLQKTIQLMTLFKLFSERGLYILLAIGYFMVIGRGEPNSFIAKKAQFRHDKVKL